MSIVKYTKKYLMFGALALIVGLGIGGLIYSQGQKGRDVHGRSVRPAQSPDKSDPPRQNLWQKIMPRFKKKPKTSHSHDHHDLEPPPALPPRKLPRDLQERLDKVRSNGNSYYTNPNFYQEVFEAVNNGRDIETTIKLLKEYRIYTDVVLEHMDGYEAFRYIQRNAGGDADRDDLLLVYAKRIISEDPSSAEALEAGLYLARMLKDPHEKETYLRGTLKYHPNSTLALFHLGDTILFERPEEAIVYFKKTIPLGQIGESSLDLADRHLGIAYQRLGDYKTAWVHFKKAQAVDPHHPWARGHLEAIAKGEPAILPVQRDSTAAAIASDITPPSVDTSAPPSEVFVDAFVVPEDVPAVPQASESASPEELARQEAEHQAFLKMLREQEEFTRRLAEDEQFKAEYFQEVENFINWAESIMNDTPIDTNNFLAKEMERHLLGKQTTFDPDRIKRGFEFINKYGQAEGIKRLQKNDPDLAKQVTQLFNQKRVPPPNPRDK